MTEPVTTERRERFPWLIVILIILGGGILLGVLFPTISCPPEPGDKTLAKNDTLQTVNAVKAYNTEYGKYPTTATTDTQLTNADAATLLNELRVPTGYTPIMNPRKIVFLELPDAKKGRKIWMPWNKRETTKKSGINAKGEWLDPWGNPYKVMLDVDYNGQLTNPYATNAGDKTLVTGVIVWSMGRDGKTNTDKNHKDAKDDVISWQ